MRWIGRLYHWVGYQLRDIVRPEEGEMLRGEKRVTYAEKKRPVPVRMVM
jgi:hypothetical protein